MTQGHVVYDRVVTFCRRGSFPDALHLSLLFFILKIIKLYARSHLPDTPLHGERWDFCRKVKFLSPALGKDFCIRRIRRKNPDCGACSLFKVLAMRAGHPMELHWRRVPVLGQGGMWEKMKDD